MRCMDSPKGIPNHPFPQGVPRLVCAMVPGPLTGTKPHVDRLPLRGYWTVILPDSHPAEAKMQNVAMKHLHNLAPSPYLTRQLPFPAMHHGCKGMTTQGIRDALSCQESSSQKISFNIAPSVLDANKRSRHRCPNLLILLLNI